MHCHKCNCQLSNTIPAFFTDKYETTTKLRDFSQHKNFKNVFKQSGYRN